jgi:hypothetical protein
MNLKTIITSQLEAIGLEKFTNLTPEIETIIGPGVEKTVRKMVAPALRKAIRQTVRPQTNKPQQQKETTSNETSK